jgi:hypothetical protein
LCFTSPQGDHELPLDDGLPILRSPWFSQGTRELIVVVSLAGSSLAALSP